MKLLGMLLLILSIGFGVGTYYQTCTKNSLNSTKAIIVSDVLNYHVVEEYGLRDFALDSSSLSELEFPEHRIQLIKINDNTFTGHYDSLKSDENTFDIVVELTDDLNYARITLDIVGWDDLITLHAIKI